MPSWTVIGTQFGDEGKGKVTDYLAKDADFVVRYQGGNNAGHTVVVGEKTYKLHHLPSGVVYGKHVLMAAGMCIDPKVLKQELDALAEKAPTRLTIDPRAHIIMPWHPLEDAAREDNNQGSEKRIGTTKRGIGPCYADRARRVGVRFEDLVDESRLREKVSELFPLKKRSLEHVYGARVDFTEKNVFDEYRALGKQFAALLGDVSVLVTDALDAGKNVLFEGAQGAFLDVDFGTYPFVTSSHPLSGGITTGVGIPPQKVERVIGVVKAYTTRVGEGPFPTELHGKAAEKLRAQGNEFGTTTGRPRRVGWLDLPMLRTAHRLNGFTELAVTKLDVLSGLAELQVATRYRVGAKTVEFFPYSTASAQAAEPVYESLPGFSFNAGDIEAFEDLPAEARDYLAFLEKGLDVPVKIVSIGPGRKQTLVR